MGEGVSNLPAVVRAWALPAFLESICWITFWCVFILRLSKCGECQSFSLQPYIIQLSLVWKGSGNAIAKQDAPGL